MIFSGFFEERACASCGDTRARVTPTSLPFFVLMAVGGLAVLTEAFGEMLEPRWWYFAAGFVGELALTVLLLCVLLWARERVAPLPDTCSGCSGAMVRTARGFFDSGILPSWSEVVVLVTFVAVHVAVLAWLNPVEGMASGGLWTVLPFFWTPPRNSAGLSPETW